MITLKLTKNKIGSLIQIIDDIIYPLRFEREKLKHSLKRAEIMAHLFVLSDLSKKLRRKQIQVEDRFQEYSFSLSVNEIEAYTLILYRNYYHKNPEESFKLLTMEQITEPIFKHLLA